jgi:signal peptide peptidase SppA
MLKQTNRSSSKRPRSRIEGDGMTHQSFADARQRPWAILPTALQAMTEFINLNPLLGTLSVEEIWAHLTMRTSPGPSSRVAGRVAILSMVEPIGRASLNQFTEALRAARSDPGIRAIVFDIDSPGGPVDGVPKLASEIAGGRVPKKTVAVANTLAASAAYWLASAADEVVITPSGSVGSIGVLAMHEDLSKALEAEGVKVSIVSAGKYKTEGNPYEPLSAEGRANLQSWVNQFGSMLLDQEAQAVEEYEVSAPESSPGTGEAFVRVGIVPMGSEIVPARFQLLEWARRRANNVWRLFAGS